MATASVNPSDGQAPLTGNFTGSGKDPDRAIVRYTWDVDGDFDFTSTTTGTYHTTIRVTDTDGMTATAPARATAVEMYREIDQ